MATWIIVISWATKAVLVLLMGLSVWSISIMLDRVKAMRKAEEPEGLQFRIKKLLEATSGQSIQLRGLAIGALLSEEKKKLEKGLSVLGSLGSSTPFIGLFGTVLGVIQAFGALAEEQGNMQVVMASISEALIATAVGLFVAIPAVLAYNYFARRLRSLLTECEILRDRAFAESGK